MKNYETAIAMKKHYSLRPGASISRMPNVGKVAFMKKYNNAASTIARSYARKKKMNEARAVRERNALKVIHKSLMHYLYRPGGMRTRSIQNRFVKMGGGR